MKYQAATAEQTEEESALVIGELSNRNTYGNENVRNLLKTNINASAQSQHLWESLHALLAGESQ